MKLELSNIQGLIPFKVFLCDADFQECQVIDENFKKTSFQMEYQGNLPSVGLKIVTKNNKEYKKVFSNLMQAFVDCPLTVSIQGDNPTPNSADGSATVLISNCYGEPSIMWSTGQNTLFISGLTGGTYSVTVTDPSKESCFKTAEITLYEDFYLKVENLKSISFDSLVSNNEYQINWGDGFVTYDSSETQPSKSYLTQYTGTITIRNTSLANISSLSDSFVSGKVIFETKELNKLINLTTFENNTTITEGKLTDLPTSLQKLKLIGNITGDCNELPPNLLELVTLGDILLTGDTASLPPNLTKLVIEKNEISGDTSNLPINLTSLTISDFTTIQGSTFSLPTNLVFLKISGYNTLTDSVNGLPPNLEHLEVWGNNTISGYLVNLPSNLKTLIIAGSNTLQGDLNSLPNSIDDKIYLGGNNTVGGDINSIQSGVTSIFLAGSGTTTGSFVTGNINNISPNLSSLIVLGYNELSGEILNTSNHSRLTYLQIEGNNTISGDTADLPENLSTIRILGQNTINTFTGGTKTFWPKISQIYLKPTVAFSSTDINNFLQSLVTLKAKPQQTGYIVIKGVLDLNDAITKSNYDYLVSLGFKINISPTL